MAKFIKNKYHRWYYNIVHKAWVRGKPDGYYEGHHVIPECLDGKDTEFNIVNLTFREHFLVHWLLTKFTTGKSKWRMLNAFVGMRRSNKKVRRVLSGWQFSMLKTIAKTSFTGSNHPSYGRSHSPEARAKISAKKKGRKTGPPSMETRLKISKSHIGEKFTEERCKNISISLKGKMSEERKMKISKEKTGNKYNLGKKLSEETKMRISISNKEGGKKAGANNPFYGKSHTNEALQILRDKAKFRIETFGFSEETRNKIAVHSRGEKNNGSKLTDEKVMQIRFMRSEGASTKELSTIYDVSKSAIARIINGTTWKHLKDRSVWSTPTITEIEA